MNPLWAYFVVAVVVFLAGLFAGRGMVRSRKLREIEEAAESRQSDALTALDHVVAREYDAAYAILSGLARHRDATPEVYFALAALLRAMQRPDRSAQVLRTILARPNLSRQTEQRAKIALARDLVQLGRGHEAKDILDTLPKKLRAEAQALALQSEAALQRGDWDTAMSAGTALAKRGRKDGEAQADVYARIAEEAAALGDLEAAHKGFRKALKAVPDSVRAHHGLAQLYLEEGKTSRARRQLTEALEANPALAPLLLRQLRGLLSENGDAETRFDELLDELDGRPGISLWVSLERADRAYQLTQLGQAKDLLEGLIERHPKSVEAHEAYLNLLLELEDHRALAREIGRFIDLAAEEIRRFRCGQCGYLSAKPFMTCPNCRTIGALVYEG